MTFYGLVLICFAAGTLIHGVYLVLVAKRWNLTTGAARVVALEGLFVGIVTFLWMFGNFCTSFLWNVGVFPGTVLFGVSDFIREASLACFPLLFAHTNIPPVSDPVARRLIAVARLLRYPLWPWTILAIFIFGAWEVGYRRVPIDPNLTAMITLHVMLLYLVIFFVISVRNRNVASGPAQVRAFRAIIIAATLGMVFFVLMLSGYWHLDVPFLSYIELAAMMTGVPYTIAGAYRSYQFPFMDAFVREVLAGLILLAAFLITFSIETAYLPGALLTLWVVASALLLAYAKEPVTLWVERTFLGHQEPIEEQEERVGNAIRGLTRLDEFSTRVSEVLAAELEAEWLEIAPASRSDSSHQFEIPGSFTLWLSVGPRIGGRQYMSRELRLARTAALQLATHHHQLSQHELRELTTRAQMRALQAQINPHFLFNTLNVLASLIHSNPGKAEHITEELAEIFRYALESTRSEWVLLDDELRFLESYLEIEKARFEERLAYAFDVDPSVRSLRIPPMILQPLVENAIKHGIGPKVEGGEIRITARLDADRLVLIVEDTGVGHRVKSRQRGTGIGLNNVRERLQHVYGESGGLTLQELTPAGTRALLVLPQLVGVHS